MYIYVPYTGQIWFTTDSRHCKILEDHLSLFSLMFSNILCSLLLKSNKPHKPFKHQKQALWRVCTWPLVIRLTFLLCLAEQCVWIEKEGIAGKTENCSPVWSVLCLANQPLAADVSTAQDSENQYRTFRPHLSVWLADPRHVAPLTWDHSLEHLPWHTPTILQLNAK